MRRKMKNILYLFVLISTLTSTVYSYSASEICFGVNHPQISRPGISLPVFALNTSGLTSNIHATLLLGGYTGSNYYINNTGNTILNSMQNRAIFYYGGHGNSGSIKPSYYDSNTRTYRFDTITASYRSSGVDSTPGFYNINQGKIYSMSVKYSNTTSKLRYMKLAYFSSCNSAVTDPTYGNLIWQAVSLGADAALGFSSTIQNNQSTYFDKQFFSNALFVKSYPSGNTQTIKQAATQAVSDTKYYYGSTGGVETFTIAPISPDGGSVKITPAANGVY